MQIGIEAPAIVVDRRNGLEIVVLRERNFNSHTGEATVSAYAYAVRSAGRVVWTRDAMADAAADAAAWVSVRTYFESAA